jgi:hypothetical protein
MYPKYDKLKTNGGNTKAKNGNQFGLIWGEDRLHDIRTL